MNKSMNRTVTITRYPNVTEPCGSRLQGTWIELIDRLRAEAPPGAPVDKRADKKAMGGWKEKHLPLWSPGTFTGDRRSRDTVEALSAVVLDLETLPIELARFELARFAGWLHTSASHCDARASLRAILPLDRDVGAAEYDDVHASIVATLPSEDALKAARAAKDPSRPWYEPTADAQWIELTGEPIGVDAILEAVRAREEAEARARATRAPSVRKARVDASKGPADAEGERRYALRALDGACDDLRRTPLGERHATLYGKAHKLGGFVRPELLDAAEVVTALFNAIQGWDPNAMAEHRKAIRDGIEKGMTKPLDVPEKTLDAAGAGSMHELVDRLGIDIDIERTAIQEEGCSRDSARVTSAAALLASFSEVPTNMHQTDLGNAERLERLYGQDIRYSPGRGWLIWDGRRWKADGEAEVHQMAVKTVRSIYGEAAKLNDSAQRKDLANWAKKSESSGAIRAMLDLARYRPSIHVPADRFDDGAAASDDARWLFNVLNGTIDLRTGELRPHRREDMITRLAPVAYDPNATCPAFARFLEEAQPDPDIRAFLWRLGGYALTGLTREHVLPIHYGKGRNGKSTYNELLMELMGDYARAAPPELLLEKRGDGHPADRATLLGARYSSASETDEGRALSVALVKQLTGGDTISARFMHKDFITWKPSHKLALLTNHRPKIRDTSDSIWVRVKLIPWPVSFKGREDTSLPEKLRAEHPGVLAGLVRGCLEWQTLGLAAPAVVMAATVEYREAEDLVGEFIAERCELDAKYSASADTLYNAYKNWATTRGMLPMNQTAFGRKLGDREGLERLKRGVVSWQGIRVRGGGGQT